MLPDFYAYAVWFDSAKKGQILLPHWRIIWEYVLSIWRSPLSLYERLCCIEALHTADKRDRISFAERFAKSVASNLERPATGIN